MGNWMKQHDYIPATILCSTALRTRQTAELVCEQLDFDQDAIQFDDELYLASRKILLNSIESNRDKPSPLMLIGHNPGMDEIVSYLSSNDVPRTESGKLMTTGCLARFRLPAAGQDLNQQAELLSITRPSEI
jgi:phosphohistidine phosphatase